MLTDEHNSILYSRIQATPRSEAVTAVGCRLRNPGGVSFSHFVLHSQTTWTISPVHKSEPQKKSFNIYLFKWNAVVRSGSCGDAITNQKVKIQHY